MAKKHTILFSVIIVVIIIAYVSLTSSNQWGQINEESNTTETLKMDDQSYTNDESHTLKITALIPPDDIFERMIKALPNTVNIHASVDYVDLDQFSYEQYVNYMLTEESGEIHLIPNDWVLPLAVQGYLMPLDRVLTSQYAEEQTLALTESLKWNSSIWATPFRLDPYIVLPHKTISEKLYIPTELELLEEDNEIENDNLIEDTSNQLISDTIVTDDELDVSSPIPTTQPSYFDKIIDIINTNHSNVKLVNSYRDRHDAIFHFIHYVERQGIGNGHLLSDNQTAILSLLANDPQLVSFNTIEEIASEQQNQPKFLVLTWSEILNNIAFVEQYYSVEQLSVPIYWSNGYSFVIKQQTMQHQVAGQWLEVFHRQMSLTRETYEGMPIHKTNLTKLQMDWQKKVYEQFSSLYDIRSAMKISTDWPIFYEHIDQLWKINEDKNKINAWLQDIVKHY